MITVNGVKFAENKKEFAASLFEPGGTCAGSAKRKPRQIMFYRPTGELFATIGRNAHGIYFVSCHKLENGQTWYLYTLTSNDEELFGVRGKGLIETRQIADCAYDAAFPAP